MTGSSLIPIIVPIMAFVAMGFWLGLVFYADSHPGYKRRKPQPVPDDAAAATAGRAGVADGAEGHALPDAGEQAGPGEHERIDERSSGALLS